MNLDSHPRPSPFPVEAESARAALNRLLSSSDFRNAERSGRFLRFVVDRALAGEPPGKEYRIGVEVFGRKAAFDPRVDPVVRLEARRLRLRLQHYYESVGASDEVRIEMPKGGYSVTFVSQPSEPKLEVASGSLEDTRIYDHAPVQRKPSGWFWRVIAVAATILVLLSAILLRVWHLQRISAEKRAQAVAVLPFLNLTGESDLDYLSDGITEEITGGLAATRNIRVVARTSSFRFKSNAVDVRQIGNQLNVSSIVEGSVQSSGDNLEIAVHLVRVPDGYQIWSATYHRGRANLSTVENEICDSLARALVSGANTQVRSVDAQAHELYLRGRYSLNRRSPSEVKTAINFFNQALAHDPLYADAYLGIAESYAILGANDQAPASLVFPQARAAARHALDLNGNSAEAHATLAHISEFYDWDFPLAEQEFQRALQLDPSLAEAHHWYGLALLYQGRLSEAAQQIQAARDLDPLSILPSLALARVYFYGGDYDRSLQLSREMLQFDDQYSLTHNSLGQAYEWKGDYRQAIAEFQRYEVLSKGDSDALLNLGETYALMGDKNRALGVVGNLLQDKNRYVSPYGYAEIYAVLGNTQQAYQWLETSVNQHSASCMMLLVDPAFRTLRDQPRFEEFLRKTGHPAEAPRDFLAKVKLD